MYQLKISVKKVMGVCTAAPPVKPGDYFNVSDGDISIPDGGFICLWALQSLMPLIPSKERNIAEGKKEDWMWRVHHAQCPDPKGRVIFKIEQTRTVDKCANGSELPTSGAISDAQSTIRSREDGLKDLKVVVETVGGHCTSKMKLSDYFILRSGRIYIPSGRHFCLYALQAALPLLPAKQRALNDGDWLKDDCRVLCPDPAGNVILRIDALE